MYYLCFRCFDDVFVVGLLGKDRIRIEILTGFWCSKQKNIKAFNSRNLGFNALIVNVKADLVLRVKQDKLIEPVAYDIK